MSRMTHAKISGYLRQQFAAYVKHYNFDTFNGTSQLGAKTNREQEMIDLAVNYGRAQAYKEIAVMIDGADEKIKHFGEPS